MDLVNVIKKFKCYVSVNKIKFKQIVVVVHFVHQDVNKFYLVGIFVNFSVINHLALQENAKKYVGKYVHVDMYVFKDVTHQLNALTIHAKHKF